MQQLIDDNEAELRRKTRSKELAKQRKIKRTNNKPLLKKEKEEKSQNLKETILQMTESGLTAQEIADKLGISRRKVFYYKKL